MESANVDIAIFDPSFRRLLGPSPRISLCLEEPHIPLFHEAGVFIEETGELFVTSNQYKGQDGTKVISIVKVKIIDGSYSHEMIFPDISMANGGVNYKDGILFCEQGSLTRPGGLVHMSIRPPYQTSTILSGFMGVPFNSVNDVVTAEDGAIWFTDPIYGYEQGIRPAPRLPPQVYRYQPSSNNIRAMADGFGRPNGIAFSPDESIIYVTDTDHIHGDGNIDPTRASTIYAFDVMRIDGQPFLANRRLFAFAEGRAPDGIKCDMDGNVYSGCLDGINVWSPSGVLLGKILIPGGVANFCFCRAGEIMAMNERRLWRITLADSTVGALLRHGWDRRKTT